LNKMPTPTSVTTPEFPIASTTFDDA